MTPLRRKLAGLLLSLVLLIVAGAVLERTRREVDLTASRSLTLSDETRDVVRRVRRRVEITAFLRRSEAGRAEASALLTRYRRVNRRIAFRILDPDGAPGEVARLDIDPAFGGVALAMGDRVERASTVSEQDITGGLARLLRNRAATACFAIGHGERDPHATVGEGLALAAGLLERNGYRVMSVDLLVQPRIPEDCGAVVLASPTAPLGDAEKAFAEWLAQGGRALVLSDPGSTVDLTPLLAAYGMRVEHGLVFEGDPAARLPGDPLTPAVSSYRSAVPVVRRLPPTIFPGAQGIAVDDEGIAGLTSVAIATTSPAAYLERQPETPNFDPATDVEGPIAIAATADLSGNFGGRVQRTRVVVVADVDFVSNSHLAQVGNSRLFVQALDWLTLQNDLVSVSANVPELRPLDLTEARARYARLVSAGIVPALFILIGAMVWAVRRGR